MKTIIHVIDSLGRGGAEVLLEGIIEGMPSYRHIIVYLHENDTYGSFLKAHKTISLNFTSKKNIFEVVWRLRMLIKTYKADLVHSHLYWGTIISRFAIPKGTQLISSYHSLLYEPSNKAQYSKRMLLLDKLTYKSKYHTIFVSEVVKELVSKEVGIKANNSVLHNFVEDKFFLSPSKKVYHSNDKLRVISIGNLRSEKNYFLILDAFSKLAYSRIELHIYGKGRQEEKIKDQILKLGLTNVKLKGQTDQPEKLLPNYHLFLSASNFEGFGIAVVESMAAGVPCLLSNIPAHLEIASDNALYFVAQNVDSLTQKLLYILKNRYVMSSFGELGRRRANVFRKDNYLMKLNKLYQKEPTD